MRIFFFNSTKSSLLPLCFVVFVVWLFIFLARNQNPFIANESSIWWGYKSSVQRNGKFLILKIYKMKIYFTSFLINWTVEWKMMDVTTNCKPIGLICVRLALPINEITKNSHSLSDSVDYFVSTFYLFKFCLLFWWFKWNGENPKSSIDDAPDSKFRLNGPFSLSLSLFLHVLKEEIEIDFQWFCICV